jgi:hypothetical protein
MFRRDQVRKVVPKLEQNAGPAPPKGVSKILRHVQHFFLQLSANVASLSVALECAEGTALPRSWVTSLLDSRRSSDSSADADRRLASVVQHVFSTLLRLHDGLILVTSGECRHDADAALARSSPFPSRLISGEGGESNVYRRDGVYSGTGWDEWADERNGLQARLVHASKKSWDALSRGTGIEHLLNQLEADIRRLEDSFSRLKAAVERALLPPLQQTLRAANVKIRLSFQCKMESMTIHAPAAKYSMEWKRLAGQFQLGETVLPQRISRNEWENMLGYREPQSTSSSSSSAAAVASAAIPRSKNQKRKRQCMFDDSDDEEEEEGPSAPEKSAAGANLTRAAPPITTATVTTTGLVVQQKQRRDLAVRDRGGPTPDHQPCDSVNVNDIKAALGVDVTDLEASHAALQEEEVAALDEAQRVDSLEESENYERKYRVLRKELDRALRKVPQRPDDDDDLIWDLRDCARLAAMEAGNQNLLSEGSEDGRHDAADRRKALERALYFFKAAQELVEDQERLHDRMTRRRGGDGQQDATAGLFRRNLLFLKGQAHVNAAIALVELFRVKPKSSWKQQANEQFQLAEDSVEALRNEAVSDRHPSIDAKIDEIKAKELRLLTGRWQCVLNWISGERSRAIELFRELMSDDASALEESIAVNECAEAALKVRVELYHCGVTLADLVVSALEAAGVSRIRQDASEFDMLLRAFEDAVNGAAHQSLRLYNSVEKLESTWLCDANILDENGIQTQDDLRQFVQSTQDWWSRKKTLSLQPIQHDSREVGDRMDHLTEFSAFAQDDVAQPPRRLVVYGSSIFPKKTRSRRAVLGSGSENVRSSTTCRPPRQEPRKYRRWGDELLPQVMDENGRLVPKLAYPTIAPEMPPEIKELFDSLRLASAKT